MAAVCTASVRMSGRVADIIRSRNVGLNSDALYGEALDKGIGRYVPWVARRMGFQAADWAGPFLQ
eukprot:6322126-Lingulodinium_polyedra.AAC.1